MHQELTQTELREIQVGLLAELHRFCEEQGLTYYLIGGTLLGAVRHQGYIPWDDDVDVILPRPDYDRLVALYNQNAAGAFRLLSLETDERYYLPFGKLIDTRTVLRQKLHVDCEIGVYLDLFPLDNLSDSRETAQKQLHRIQMWKRMLEVKQNLLSNTRAAWKNMVFAAGKLALLPISQRKIIRKIDSLCRVYENPALSGFVGRAAYGQYGDREIMQGKWFQNRVNAQFEGLNLYIPAGYDEMLTQLYGDYHSLPPEKDRRPHHVFQAWYKEKL